MILTVMAFGFLLTAIAMTYYSIVVIKGNQKTYANVATNVSSTVAEVVNVEEFIDLKDQVKAIVDASEDKPLSDERGSERWNAYIEQFDAIKNSEKFKKMHEFLRKIDDINSNDIDCLYLAYVDNVNKLVVYVVDSEVGDDACPPGCLDELLEKNYKILDDPKIGFPAYTSNMGSYGELVTAGHAIYHNDEVVGYAMADISITTVRRLETNSIVRLLLYLIVTVGLLTVAGILSFNHFMIRPIKKLTTVANSYDIRNPNKTHESFTKLDVKSNDELGDLALSMKKMEEDVNKKIVELTETSQELEASKQEVQEMTELANKDALTGVRNKAAYNAEVALIDQDIKNGKIVRFGIAMVDLNYLKLINDKYGHNDGDAALIKISNLVCTIFAHSPVFRIGGDEFVVILKNADYKRADKLVKEFNKKIDSLRKDDDLLPAEKVSAAIGYAIYDETTDTCVDDVFNRADKAMYQRKHWMKANE